MAAEEVRAEVASEEAASAEASAEATAEAAATEAPAHAEAPAQQEEQAQVEPAGEESAADDVLALRAALEEAQRERESYLDHLRRERAEFENFRKRTTKERMDALDRGAEQLVGSMLGVLDNLRLALDAAESSPDEKLAKGMEMVGGELLGVLQRAGLEEVPGVGEVFDPTVHEAVLQVEADEEREESVVVEVLRPGYRFKGRVLRPAAVKVAK